MISDHVIGGTFSSCCAVTEEQGSWAVRGELPPGGAEYYSIRAGMFRMCFGCVFGAVLSVGILIFNKLNSIMGQAHQHAVHYAFLFS